MRGLCSRAVARVNVPAMWDRLPGFGRAVTKTTARRNGAVAVFAITMIVTACTPNSEVRRASGMAAPVDSIVLERGVCFGFCPAYRLRIASSGAVRYEPRNPDGSASTDAITPLAFAGLVQEAERIGLGSYPSDIQEDRRLCAMQATDHPSATISIFGEETKRVHDYTGCHAAEGDGESAERLQLLRAFEARIDSVAGASRWTTRPNIR